MNSPCEDTFSINLRFDDGSIGTILYFANGNKGFPKERLEIFCGGKILVLDNFKRLKGFGWGNFKKMKVPTQDKGHAAEVRAFIESIRKGSVSIRYEEVAEVSKATIELSNNWNFSMQEKKDCLP
jgi:predicted dehydrogenase